MKLDNQAKHLRQFQTGRLYCRHLKYYASVENQKEVFYDDHEGVGVMLRSPILSGDMPEYMQTPGRLTMTRENDLVDPVFCMHSIAILGGLPAQASLEEIKALLTIPEEMSGSRPHAVLITNALEFKNRVEAEVLKRRILCRQGPVEYVDESMLNGLIDPRSVGFIKRRKFVHEREYRFVLKSKLRLSDPYELDIGSIHDISMLITVKEFNRRLHLLPARDVGGGFEVAI